MADKTATIEFDEYPGKTFTVRLSPVSLDDYIGITELLGNISDFASIGELVERFGEVAFVGWEGYDDEPTAANLRKRDMSLLVALVGQWIKAVAQVPAPLPVRPASGGPSKARRASKSRRN